MSLTKFINVLQSLRDHTHSVLVQIFGLQNEIFDLQIWKTEPCMRPPFCFAEISFTSSLFGVPRKISLFFFI